MKIIYLHLLDNWKKAFELIDAGDIKKLTYGLVAGENDFKETFFHRLFRNYKDIKIIIDVLDHLDDLSETNKELKDLFRQKDMHGHSMLTTYLFHKYEEDSFWKSVPPSFWEKNCNSEDSFEVIDFFTDYSISLHADKISLTPFEYRTIKGDCEWKNTGNSGDEGYSTKPGDALNKLSKFCDKKLYGRLLTNGEVEASEYNILIKPISNGSSFTAEEISKLFLYNYFFDYCNREVDPHSSNYTVSRIIGFSQCGPKMPSFFKLGICKHVTPDALFPREIIEYIMRKLKPSDIIYLPIQFPNSKKRSLEFNESEESKHPKLLDGSDLGEGLKDPVLETQGEVNHPNFD